MRARIDPQRRSEADALIRALSMVAGDERKVAALLSDYAEGAGVHRAVSVCMAALTLTFGSCMSQPVPLTLNDTTTTEREKA